MRLTLYGDYSLRLLIYLALNFGRVTTTREVAESYQISKNHLVKVVKSLLEWGYIKSVQGRRGGLLLARDPADINVGSVLRLIQRNFDFVECFDAETNQCCIAGACQLNPIFHEALHAYFCVLDKYTLKDISAAQGMLRSRLQIDKNPQS